MPQKLVDYHNLVARENEKNKKKSFLLLFITITVKTTTRRQEKTSRGFAFSPSFYDYDDDFLCLIKFKHRIIVIHIIIHIFLRNFIEHDYVYNMIPSLMFCTYCYVLSLSHAMPAIPLLSTQIYIDNLTMNREAVVSRQQNRAA